jgi:hypothetical protein
MFLTEVTMTISGLLNSLAGDARRFWCFDASLDPPGTALSLAQSLNLISSELGLKVTFEMDKFRLDENENSVSANLLKSTYVKGTIRSRKAADGYACELHVVKLSDRSPTIRPRPHGIFFLHFAPAVGPGTRSTQRDSGPEPIRTQREAV